MISKMSYQEYFEMLQVLEGYTAKEAATIIVKEYKKQWGIDPFTHKKYLDAVWKDDRSASKHNV